MNRQLIAVAALCAVSLLAPASAQDSGSADIAEAQSVAATEAASRNEFRSLDKDVQDLKKEVLDLNRDLFLLEEELLFPANSQVAFFVSMAAGDFVDAELRLKEFLLQYPAYPGAWVNLAIIHRQNGDDQQALADVEKALAIDPNHAVALNQKGLLFRRNGNFLEAEAAYLKAVTASPEYALAHYNLGVLNELYLQRLDAALQHFEAYQLLVGEDKQVEKWITDLRRRVAANQRTANVAE